MKPFYSNNVTADPTYIKAKTSNFEGGFYGKMSDFKETWQ